MSLRQRLLLSIGGSLLLLWGAVAAWMLGDLEQRLGRTLDQRLAMSARMVSSLMAQNPGAWEGTSTPLPRIAVPAARGIACQVSSLHGQVVASTPETEPEGMAAAPVGFGELQMSGERWRTFSIVSDGFRVTTADRLAEREALLRGVTVAAVVPFIVAFAGSVLVLGIVLRRELRPLERLRRTLEGRRPDSVQPVPASGMPRELRPLVETLNGLLERVAHALARERRFTSDAAHELRSPLTAVTTHLQLARMTSHGQAADAVESALEGAARLHHRLAQLLTLSRVEGPFSWDDGVTAYADELLSQAIDEVAPRGRIAIPGSVPRVALAVPGALAVIALRNLLDNALRFSPEGAPVEVRAERLAQAVRYTVRDRGPGLGEAELDLATQRFWRKGPGEGSGLGLSIVAVIAERFGACFRLANTAGGGLEATIAFPVASASGPGGP